MGKSAINRHLVSRWTIAFLLCQSSALAKSDWVDEDILDPAIKSPVFARPAGGSGGQMPSGEIKTVLPDDGDQDPQPIHGGQGAPLKGGVKQFENTITNSGRLSSAAAQWRETILHNAPFLPPPKERQISTQVFRTWLQSSNPEFFAKLGTIGKTAVIEVKGTWDDAGHILRALGIPYSRVGAESLDKIPLERTRVLVINCGATLNGQAQRAVNKFVSDGGFLLTTDWALDSCLRPCFPGLVVWNGGYTDSQVVDAVVVGQDSKLLKETVSPAFWKLEDKSQLVRVLNSQVDVLVRSRQLMREDPSQKGVLALSFPFGKGKVLHLVGHFDNNSRCAFTNTLVDPSPNIVISLRQAIASNFIASAFAQDTVASEDSLSP